MLLWRSCVSENKYNHELGQYSKRRLLCGLSGRFADRHFLNIMLQSGEKPVAIIEEYERRQEVERFLSEHPDWKPAVRYVSKNPELQQKYPMFTKESFNEFLYAHKIGFCILSFVDHETDNFIHTHFYTGIAKNLLVRTQIENQLADYVGHYIANIYDNPTMFRYLDAERIAELKANFQYNQDVAYTLDLEPQELVDTLQFMSYMVECLDGRNAVRPIMENQIRGAVAQNTEKLNLRSAEGYVENFENGTCCDLVSDVWSESEAKSAEKARSTGTNDSNETWETTKSARKRRYLIFQRIRKIFDEVVGAVFENKENQNGSLIRELVTEMNEFTPEVKRMHHKLQERILRYIRNTAAFLGSQINNTTSRSTKRLYEELSEVLNESVLSNGQREQVRTARKKMTIDNQERVHRVAMSQAATREEAKRISRAQQRFDDLAAQGRRTQEEIQQIEEAKKQRRAVDKARKIAKRIARSNKNGRVSDAEAQRVEVVVEAPRAKSPITRNDIMRIHLTVDQFATPLKKQFFSKKDGSDKVDTGTPFYAEIFPSGFVNNQKIRDGKGKVNMSLFKQKQGNHMRGG